MRTKIPIYHQKAEAVAGIFVLHLTTAEAENHLQNVPAHRDDFFNFFILLKGRAVMKCDMVDIEIIAPSAIIVKPFQIHSPQELSADATGYYISAAPFIIPNSCFEVFQNLKISEQAFKIIPSIQKELLDTVSILYLSFTNNNYNKAQIIHGLFNAIVYHFSNSYQLLVKKTTEPLKQSGLITTKFKKLITENSFLETPSFFAKKLNISTSHLNDCVNITTGKSVTYWLQNTMIIEAKRLLYYTEYDVKEVAFNLGFEDNAYFSRLFKKITGETPLAFRRKFRE